MSFYLILDISLNTIMSDSDSGHSQHEFDMRLTSLTVGGFFQRVEAGQGDRRVIQVVDA